MSITNRLQILAMLALLLGWFLPQPSLHAQQYPSSSNPATQQQPMPAVGQPPAMDQTSNSHTFAGKIAKSGGKLVLKDSASESTYALDDQDRARQFEGQKVKVIGTLDAPTNTIRVATISPKP